MNILSWFSWKFSCMLQCYSFSFTFAMKQFTFIKLQFQFCICRKNLIHRICSIAMYLSDHKESACNAEIRVQTLGLEDPCRGKWRPTPVFLPGESHGQRSLAGYSRWFTKSQTRLKTKIFTFLISQFFLWKTEIITVGFCLRYFLTIQI